MFGLATVPAVGLVAAVVLAAAPPPPAPRPPTSPPGAVGRAPGRAATIDVRDLRRVEPLVADANPLSFAGRVQGANLSVPSSFGAGLYQIPANANSRYAGWFVRAQGGMYAVFPRSDYAVQDDRIFAVIPPGTQFFMGGVPGALQAGARPGGPSSPLPPRAEPSPPPIVPDFAARPDDERPRVLTDAARPPEDGAARVARALASEGFRGARLESLLQAAATGG